MPLGAKEKQVGIWNLEGKGGHLRGFGKSKCLVSRRLPLPTETKGPREECGQAGLAESPHLLAPTHRGHRR